MKNSIKILLLILSYSVFSHINQVHSQTINRYIFPHPNRKNDSQISYSPYSSGYNTSKALEFSYEPIPTVSMKNRANSIIPQKSTLKEYKYYNEESKLDSFYEQQSNFLKDLDNEANLAIQKQKEETEKAQLIEQQNNIASFTAYLKSKKKPDKPTVETQSEAK